MLNSIRFALLTWFKSPVGFSFFSLILLQNLALPNDTAARPVSMVWRKIEGVPVYLTTVDLSDRKTHISMGLANNSNLSNLQGAKGDESFASMVSRYRAAVVINGTYFSKNSEKRLMGNIVSLGQFLKYRPWENYGTTLGLREKNAPEMLTSRLEGTPDWHQHWFSITAGPRLLRGGKFFLNPYQEGFRDPEILRPAHRSAIGFSANRTKLFLVTFLGRISLQKEAQIMKKIGAQEAMNLDGGASVALSYRGKILVHPKRKLTNVILIYDAHHPAPSAIPEAWKRFQEGERPQQRRLLG